jgi:hypothetical protein
VAADGLALDRGSPKLGVGQPKVLARDVLFVDGAFREQVIDVRDGAEASWRRVRIKKCSAVDITAAMLAPLCVPNTFCAACCLGRSSHAPRRNRVAILRPCLGTRLGGR